MKKTGKAVIVIVMHGAPVPSSVYSEVDALVSAGYTGQGKFKNWPLIKLASIKCDIVPFIQIQKVVMQC